MCRLGQPADATRAQPSPYSTPTPAASGFNVPPPPTCATWDPKIECTPKVRYAAFDALLREIKTLHDSKGADYESDGVEYSNLTAAEQWGIPAWKYAMNRVDEKLNRLKSYAQGSTLQHEVARDSMIDIAVLSLIAIVLKERAETKQLAWITTHQQQQEGSNHAEVSSESGRRHQPPKCEDPVHPNGRERC